MVRFLVGTLVACSALLLSLQVFVSSHAYAQTVTTIGYSGVGTCDPSQTSSNVTATGVTEILQAEDMWDAGNQTPASMKSSGSGTLVWLMSNGASVWGTFSNPSDNVVVQFSGSDSNDGPLNIYVDGALVASNLDSWQQGRWYVEITDLPNVVHTVKVEDASGVSACGGDHVSVDWFGTKPPPSVTITDPPASSWQTGNFQLQFDAQGVSTCEIWVDDGNTGTFVQKNAISSCISGSTGIQVGPPPSNWCSTEGQDKCVVRIVGKKAGLPDVQSEEVFSIDYTDPAVSFDVPPTPAAGSDLAADFPIQYNTSDNIQLASCELASSNDGGGTWTTRASSCGPQTDTGLIPGWCSPGVKCSIRIWARDLAGNIGEEILHFKGAFTGGLVPCGRDTNDPLTLGIDESQPCTLCHGFALVHNIVDFLLVPTNTNNGFAIVMLFGGLMLAVAGFTFLVGSLGNPGLRNRGRQILFTTIIALLIIYGSWLAIDFILSFFGVTIWTGPGSWWQVQCG